MHFDYTAPFIIMAFKRTERTSFAVRYRLASDIVLMFLTLAVTFDITMFAVVALALES